jgi:hypothetical protein
MLALPGFAAILCARSNSVAHAPSPGDAFRGPYSRFESGATVRKGSDGGAAHADIFMSLIHTAELCHVEPFDYLVALQRHAAAVLLEPGAWMPWNYTATLARVSAPTSDNPASD